MHGIPTIFGCARALHPHRWRLLSGAVVPSLSVGLAAATFALGGGPLGLLSPPGSFFFVIIFPSLAGFLCAVTLHPERSPILARITPSARQATAWALALALVLLAVVPVAYVLWDCASWVD